MVTQDSMNNAKVSKYELSVFVVTGIKDQIERKDK